MLLWVQFVLVLCVVAVTVVAVPALLAIRRAALKADTILAVLEQDLRPLLGQAAALTEDLQALSRQADRELGRFGVMVERIDALSQGLGRLATGLMGLTRAGQLIGVAAGIRKGIDVFVHRLRREQGDGS
ncbi:MAG: hypothetical protein HY727_21230 [Candidatus Rokubacteria bacterium]|nr:hypothetical protein [Candidatus Rokubacteria bacterium]